MALLVALLIAFPGERIATLPTGKVLKAGIWQLSISHRFLPDADNSTLGTPWNFLRGANVRLAVERGLPGRFNVGASFNSAGGDMKEIGLAGSWMPLKWLTVQASAGTNVVDIGLPGTWLSASAAVLTPVNDRYHLVAMPRLTTNTEDTYVSVGLGGEVNVWDDFSFGAEAEPVLAGPADNTRLLAWNVAIDKELGWHNFTLTVGNAWHQNTPGWFASANRDVTRGNVRIGFNILRRI